MNSFVAAAICAGAMGRRYIMIWNIIFLAKAAKRKMDDFKTFQKTLIEGLRLKEIMLKDGTDTATAKCSVCEGMLQARLDGRRKHLRMHCTGTCDRSIME